MMQQFLFGSSINCSLLQGKTLREKGWNRLGNLIVPNKNYCAFEDWVQPLLDQALHQQNEKNIRWTPSKLIDYLGSQIHDESSLYYWCHRNRIPVFCPGLTDGSLGDNLYFHSYRNPVSSWLFLARALMRASSSQLWVFEHAP